MFFCFTIEKFVKTQVRKRWKIKIQTAFAAVSFIFQCFCTFSEGITGRYDLAKSYHLGEKKKTSFNGIYIYFCFRKMTHGRRFLFFFSRECFFPHLALVSFLSFCFLRQSMGDPVIIVIGSEICKISSNFLFQFSSSPAMLIVFLQKTTKKHGCVCLHSVSWEMSFCQLRIPKQETRNKDWILIC